MSGLVNGSITANDNDTIHAVIRDVDTIYQPGGDGAAKPVINVRCIYNTVSHDFSWSWSSDDCDSITDLFNDDLDVYETPMTEVIFRLTQSDEKDRGKSIVNYPGKITYSGDRYDGYVGITDPNVSVDGSSLDISFYRFEWYGDGFLGERMSWNNSDGGSESDIPKIVATVTVTYDDVSGEIQSWTVDKTYAELRQMIIDYAKAACSNAGGDPDSLTDDTISITHCRVPVKIYVVYATPYATTYIPVDGFVRNYRVDFNPGAVYVEIVQSDGAGRNPQTGIWYEATNVTLLEIGTDDNIENILTVAFARSNEV